MKERPQRIQLSRQKGWRMPAGAVKVDRSTKWGNPFALEAQKDGRYAIIHLRSRGDRTGEVVATADDPVAARTESIRLYRIWVMSEAGQPIRQMAREQLRGRSLACWCPLDGPCHADVLIELANAPEARR